MWLYARLLKEDATRYTSTVRVAAVAHLPDVGVCGRYTLVWRCDLFPGFHRLDYNVNCTGMTVLE